MANQEDDCDSLDHILRMIRQNEESNKTYNNTSQQQQQYNHAASFGVGGRISAVVDPEFRLPSTIIEHSQANITHQASEMYNNQPFNNQPNQQPLPGQQAQPPPLQNTNPTPHLVYQSSAQNNPMMPNSLNSNYVNMSTTHQTHISGVNIMHNSMTSTNTNRMHPAAFPNQIPTSRNLSVPTGTVPFTVQGSPSTFQDIARRPASANPNFASNLNNIMSSTLQEYGPVTHSPQRVGPGFIPYQSSQPGPTFSGYPMGPPQMQNASMSMNAGPTRPASTGSVSTFNQLSPMGPAPMGPCPPASVTTNAPLMKQSSVISTSNKEISPPPPPPPEPSESSSNPSSSSLSSLNRQNPSDNTRPSSSGPSSSRVIYSPTPASPKSPPLDQIVPASGQLSADNQAETNMTSSGRIPKHPTVPRPGYNKDNYDGMTLQELLARYRDYEFDLEKNKRRRDDVERSLADLTRSAKGRNIEIDPDFKKLKSDQAKFGQESLQLKARLDKIKDKLNTKFTYKVQPESYARRGSSDRTQSRRAKMSTTPRSESVSKHPSGSSKLILHIKDCKTWCEKCNEHFASIEEYCDHIHTRDHKRNVPKCSPWSGSRTELEKVPQSKTYAHMKSICSKVSSHIRGDNFDVRDLDRILNYNIPERDKVLKLRQLERDRGTFRDDDPLFCYQGYKYLVPITGFYCTLCSEALCDNRQAEKHMKSYGHIEAYIKTVANDREHEKIFHIRMAKSTFAEYQERFGNKSKQSPKKSQNQSTAASEARASQMHSNPIPSTSGTSASANKQTVFIPSSVSTGNTTTNSATTTTGAPIIDINSMIGASKSSTTVAAPPPASAATPVAATTTTTTTAVHQYKKRTSHIVDEHEVVNERFPNANKPQEVRKPRSPQKKRKAEPESEPARKRASTEIIPVAKISATSALKRLRRPHVPKSKPIVESEDDSSDFEPKKSEKNRKRVSPVIMEDDESTAIEDCDSDIEIIKEISLDRGDPDSPFPDLELSITGNLHVSALKDPRLSAKCQVKLQMMKPEDYKDQLFDSASLWTRVNQLIAKKEPGELAKEVSEGVKEPEPTFLDVDGRHVPIEIEDDEQASQNKKSNDSTKSDANKDAEGDKDDDKNDGQPEFKKQMDFLEAFFCEK